MRGISILAVAVLGLGVAACGQTKADAAAELAKKQDAAAPKPAEPGQAFVGEVSPEPLRDYAVPADAADAAAVEAAPADATATEAAPQ